MFLIYSNMGHGNLFSFFENPVSDDEIAIAEVMRNYFKGLCKHNLGLILSLFAEDARIDSKAAKGIVSLEVYGREMNGILTFITEIQIKDLLIRIPEKGRAVVYGSTRYTVKGVRGMTWERMWIMRKEAMGWKIVESKYLHK